MDIIVQCSYCQKELGGENQLSFLSCSCGKFHYCSRECFDHGDYISHQSVCENAMRIEKATKWSKKNRYTLAKILELPDEIFGDYLMKIWVKRIFVAQDHVNMLYNDMNKGKKDWRRVFTILNRELEYKLREGNDYFCDEWKMRIFVSLDGKWEFSGSSMHEIGDRGTATQYSGFVQDWKSGNIFLHVSKRTTSSWSDRSGGSNKEDIDCVVPALINNKEFYWPNFESKREFKQRILHIVS